jgi:hypothetical protein
LGYQLLRILIRVTCHPGVGPMPAKVVEVRVPRTQLMAGQNLIIKGFELNTGRHSCRIHHVI